MSTESGIPDWQGASQSETNNVVEEKSDPERATLNYQAFLEDPKKWWQERLAHPSPSSVYRERAVPNPGHYALVELEKLGIIIFVITSNVDALHEKAGTRSLIEFHGSFLKLRCIRCGAIYPREEFDLEDLIQGKNLLPRCPYCQGVIKPDGVSFGEAIPGYIDYRSRFLAGTCDVMLICGTTALVYPFAELPKIAKERRPRTVKKKRAKIIEINTEPTRLTTEGIADYLIQGKVGEILPQIVTQVKKLLKKATG